MGRGKQHVEICLTRVGTPPGFQPPLFRYRNDQEADSADTGVEKAAYGIADKKAFSCTAHADGLIKICSNTRYGTGEQKNDPQEAGKEKCHLKGCRFFGMHFFQAHHKLENDRSQYTAADN